MVVCVFIINAFKKKNNGITEAIQYAIANGRPQKEIDALQKGQKKILDRLHRRIKEDSDLGRALDLQKEMLESRW